MAKIILHVGADTKEAQQAIANLKKELEKIQGTGKGFSLGMDTAQIRTATESMNKLAAAAEKARQRQEDAMWKAYRAEQEAEAKKQSQIAVGVKKQQEAEEKKAAAAEKAAKKAADAYFREQERAAAAAEKAAAREAAAAEKVRIARERAEAVSARKLADIGSEANLAKYAAQIENVTQRMGSLRSNTLAMGQSLRTLQSAFGVLQSPTASLDEKQAALKNLNTTLSTLKTQISTVSREEKAEDKAARDAAKAEREHAGAMESASGASNALAVALGTIAARAFHMVINKITQAFREALSTMKEVDSELANIQKVTDETDAVIEKVGDTAYETASKYGISASEYLSAAGDFAKAGYDNYTTMAELATKTQLVGDVNAEIASKFLLSADAAWKFQGNVEDLSSVLDKANVIENNYATSIEKLASGFPLVASTAAMAGMSVDETLAALGTITAKTQESGTMAARALRALILNILKDTKTEIEDGVTWTEAEIDSLNDLLWKYAGEAMKTAQKNGGVVNPMEAIKALHDAYVEGLLTQKELTDLAMDLGGKLRTNQLLALISNFDTFNEMLGKTAESAGSADKEIDVLLGTWKSKTNILKNTWTDFVSDLVDTSLIKGSLDSLTAFIDGLDKRLKNFSNPFTSSEEAKNTYDTLMKEYSALAMKGGELTETEKSRLDYLEKQLAVLRLQQNVEEEAAAKKLQKDLTRMNSMTHLTRDQEAAYGIRGGGDSIEWTGDPESYQQQMKALIATYSEYYNKVVQVRDAGALLTDYQKQFIQDYEAIAVIASEQNLSVGKLVDGYWSIVDASGNIVAYAKDGTIALEEQREALEKQNQIDEAQARYKQAYADMQSAKTQEDYEEAEKRWLAAEKELDSLNGKADTLGSATAAVGPNLETATPAASALADELERGKAAASGINVSVGGVSGGGNILGGGARAAGGYASGRTLVNELGPELISDHGRAFIANGGRPAVVNLNPGSIVIPARETAQALRGGMPIRAAADGNVPTYLFGSSHVDESKYVVETEALIPFIETFTTNGSNQQHGYSEIFAPAQSLGKVDALAHDYLENPEPSVKIPTTWSGTGGDYKDVAALAKDLSSLLTNLDKQATLAGNEQNWARQAEIYEQAQEAIKQMVEDYREAGYADDSDEILDLLNKNYEYANKQLTLYQTKWDELINALSADASATEAANKLAEKQQAVDDAREALANAQRQRTVRIFNSATGQWEWVADQSQVTSAQKSLTSAEQSYTDTVKSEAIAELKRLKESAADLTDVVLGPALSTVAQMAESTMEFQNFARALDAVYGVGTFLNSTEGTTKALSTVDSHDTVYSFNGLKLTDAQAQNMTVAELAKSLSILNLTV